MNKNMFLIGLLFFIASSLSQSCLVEASVFPISLKVVEEIRDGEIEYNVKGGEISVTIVDKYGDSHIHILSHEGVSQKEALKILFMKRKKLKHDRLFEGYQYNCDLDLDGDCDLKDVVFMEASMGKCDLSTNESYADLDSDGCITEDDKVHFLEVYAKYPFLELKGAEREKN